MATANHLIRRIKAQRNGNKSIDGLAEEIIEMLYSLGVEQSAFQSSIDYYLTYPRRLGNGTRWRLEQLLEKANALPGAATRPSPPTHRLRSSQTK